MLLAAPSKSGGGPEADCGDGASGDGCGLSAGPLSLLLGPQLPLQAPGCVRTQAPEQEPRGKLFALSLFSKDTGPGNVNSTTERLSYEAVLFLAEPMTDGVSTSVICFMPRYTLVLRME